MIVVHHLNNSRPQRVLWLLEELGLAYDIRRYQCDRCTMLAPPVLRAMHPLYLRCLYWLHYAEGSSMPLLLLKLIFDKIEKAPMPFFVKLIAKGISKKTKSSFIAPQLTSNLD